jgi:hypothetical protein
LRVASAFARDVRQGILTLIRCDCSTTVSLRFYDRNPPAETITFAGRDPSPRGMLIAVGAAAYDAVPVGFREPTRRPRAARFIFFREYSCSGVLTIPSLGAVAAGTFVAS